MSIMRRISLVAAFAVTVGLTGCSGDAGPAGPAGAIGPDGAAAGTCDLTVNADGSKTVTCPGADPFTISDGAAGAPCTVTKTGSITTVTCPDAAPVTVADGVGCSFTVEADGSKTITCADGTHVVVPAPDTTILAPGEEFPPLTVTIDSVSGNAGATFQPGEKITVTFTVKLDGTPITLDKLSRARVWFSGPTTNFQHLLPAADVADYYNMQTASPPPTLNANGSYTFELPDAIPTTHNAQINGSATSSGPGDLAGTTLTSGTYRVVIRASKTFTVEGETGTKSNTANATRDVGVKGGNATTAHEVVTDSQCNSCHQTLYGHGGGYRSVSVCVTCHTAGAADEDGHSVEMSVMIHKLHNGYHLPSVQGLTRDSTTGAQIYTKPADANCAGLTPVPYDCRNPYTLAGNDFSSVLFPAFPSFQVAFPRPTGYSALAVAPSGSPSNAWTPRYASDNVRKGVSNCDMCHTTSGGTLTAGQNLTRRACDSCHDDMNWVKIDNNVDHAFTTGCDTCHPPVGEAAVGGSVDKAHRHPGSTAGFGTDFVVTTLTKLEASSSLTGTWAERAAAAGDYLRFTMTVTNSASPAVDVPLGSMDSFTSLINGPTGNRQPIMPYATASGVYLSPFDFSGRLQQSGLATSSGKGSMSKIAGDSPLLSDVIEAKFDGTSLDAPATTFTVNDRGIDGSTTTALGTGSIVTEVLSADYANPVVSMSMVSDADQAGVTPLASAQSGNAWMVTNWGAGFTNGDIVGSTGTEWKVLVPAASVGATTSVFVKKTTTAADLTGTFAGKSNQYCTWTTTPPTCVAVVANQRLTFVNNLVTPATTLTYFYSTAAAAWVREGANQGGPAISNIFLTKDAVAQKITVTFTSATAFTVAGSVDTGGMGGGTLGSTDGKNASVGFTNTAGTAVGSVTFQVTTTTTAPKSGQKLYLTVFKGSGTNPVVFALLPGSVPFTQGERFYYEAIKPAGAGESYTLPVPMDIPLETLAYKTLVMTGPSTTSAKTFNAANLPVFWGRQKLYKRAASPIAAGTLATGSLALARVLHVNQTSAAPLKSGDWITINDGMSTEETVGISRIDPVNSTIYTANMLRYAHTGGEIVAKATLNALLEGIDYALVPATGLVTTVADVLNPTVAAGERLLMTYRTHGRLGWYPDKAAKSVVSTYFPPINNAETYVQNYGIWTGLPLLDGTYTLGIWGYKTVFAPLNGEVQTYRNTSALSDKNFLYGAATTVEPYALIAPITNCDNCHAEITFHGAGRRGGDTCLMCHGMNSVQAQASAADGSTINENFGFREFIHEAHEPAFPANPAGVRSCDMCHGSAMAETSTTENPLKVWEAPAARVHPSQSVPTQSYTAVCSWCHTETAKAHIDAMGSPVDGDSCPACHNGEAAPTVKVAHFELW
jgi:hypothetical protein